jgi:chemotaxis protein MotB
MKPGQQPVIILRPKKHAGHGHHGGAWKVAYADFVTAMMCFFMVMWLVNQDPAVRKAIAVYFREPGLLNHEFSNSVISGGRPGIEPGQAPNPVPHTETDVIRAERDLLAGAAKRIKEELTQTPEFAELREQVEFTITAEGLRIELVDREGSSFFASGRTELLGESERILTVIARDVSELKNDIVVEGHTDSDPYIDGRRYGNWELSAERSNAARRVMERTLREGQLRAVRGFAATQPHVPENPRDPRNRRVSVVVRSQSAAALEQAVRDGHTEGLGSAGSGKGTDSPR